MFRQCPTISPIPILILRHHMSRYVRDPWSLVNANHSTLTPCKTRLHSSSSRLIPHPLLISRTSCFPRQAVRYRAALTRVPRLPLVQPTLGYSRLWISWGAEGVKDRRSTRLILTCRYYLCQVVCTRRFQWILLRRDSRSINRFNLLQGHTQQSTVPLRGLALQLM